MAVVGLLGIALIHLLDVEGKLQEVRYVGIGFILLAVTCLILSEALIRSDATLAWLAAGAVASSALIGYAISRTSGLPGDHKADVGNWWEPLGLASLVVEGVVVLLVLGRLTDRD